MKRQIVAKSEIMVGYICAPYFLEILRSSPVTQATNSSKIYTQCSPGIPTATLFPNSGTKNQHCRMRCVLTTVTILKVNKDNSQRH